MRQALHRKPGARTAVSKWLVRACLALSCASTAAYAQFALGIAIGIPPAVAVVEATPAPRPGNVYAPEYLAWHGDRHIWTGGRWIVEQPGHLRVADHWEWVGGRWHFVQGDWAPHKYGHERGPVRGRDHD